MGIVTVIMSVVFYNQAKYSEAPTLENLAADVAITVRQASVYGLSVRVTPGSNDFSSGYGLAFDRGNAGDYIFFADKNRNQYYDSGWTCPSSSECLKKTGLTYGVDSLCYIPTSGSEVCNVGRVDITFYRPDPEAFFRFDGQTIAGVKGARMRFRSPNGSIRSVVVYTTGHVSIRND